MSDSGEVPPFSLNVQMARALGWTNIHVEDGVLVGYSQTERENGQIPDYAHSLDACASVLPEGYTPHGYDFSIRNFVGGGYVVTICQDDPPMGCRKMVEGQGVTRAEALARALLAWATAQHGKEGTVR